MARTSTKLTATTRPRAGALKAKSRKLASGRQSLQSRRSRERYLAALAFRSWVAGDPGGLDELQKVMKRTLRHVLPPGLSSSQRETALGVTWRALEGKRDEIPSGAVYVWLRNRARAEGQRLGQSDDTQTSPNTNPDDALDSRGSVKPEEYAETVAELVSTAVKKTLDMHPGASLISPEAMAAVIADLVVDDVDGVGNELVSLLAPFWTAERARSALEISRTSMAERRTRRSVLGLRTTDGDFFYPVAQFERAGGQVRVRPALRTFFMALREHDPWTVGVYLHTPAPELDDLTPLDWARSGRDPETLKTYAQVLDAELAR